MQNVKMWGDLWCLFQGIFGLQKSQALYEDTKELIYSKGEIDPEYTGLLTEWNANSVLAKLHNRVVKQIPEIVLLSEIEISDKDFEILILYAKNTLQKAQLGLDQVFPNVLFSVAMIQIGIRYYTSSYWPKVAAVLKLLSVGYNERNWIGKTVTSTLRALGKPVYSKTEYVTNILMHCFVTDYYASRFFDYLFSYYRIDLERDMSGFQEMDTDYLCDSNQFEGDKSS